MNTKYSLFLITLILIYLFKFWHAKPFFQVRAHKVTTYKYNTSTSNKAKYIQHTIQIDNLQYRVSDQSPDGSIAGHVLLLTYKQYLNT